MSAISVVPAIVSDEVVSLMSNFSVWESDLLVNKNSLYPYSTWIRKRAVWSHQLAYNWVQMPSYRWVRAGFSACSDGFYPLNTLKACATYFRQDSILSRWVTGICAQPQCAGRISWIVVNGGGKCLHILKDECYCAAIISWCKHYSESGWLMVTSRWALFGHNTGC